MNKRLRLFLLLWVFLAGCRAIDSTLDTTVTAVSIPSPTIINTVTAVPTSTPITESIPVEVTRIVVTAAPSPTPAICTSLPEDMTFTVTPTSDTAVVLELTGLQPGESLHFIFTWEDETGSSEIQLYDLPPVGDDGRHIETIDLQQAETGTYTWQIKAIHARGVACTEITLPGEGTAVPVATWSEFSSDVLHFTLQYPSAWQAVEQDGFVYLLSNERFGEGPEPLNYFVYISEYLNPENLPFPDAINASFNVDFPTITSFEETIVGPYAAYVTTDLPSREGALSVLVAGNGRYLNLALTPYRADEPYPEQERFVAIFEEILATLQVDNAIDMAAIQTGAPILFARNNDLWRADINGQNEQRLTESQLLADWFALTESGDPWWWGGFPPHVHVSPDGRWLAFTQNGHNLVLVDVTGTEETRISPLSGTVTVFTWSPDSRQFVFGSNTLKLYDVATNSITNLLSGYGQGVHNPVWSPDGRFLAFACCFEQPGPGPYDGVLAGEIRQFELASGQVETVGETWNSVGGGTPSICWTADGTVGIDVAEPVTCSFDPQAMGHLPGDSRYAYFFIQSPDENELFHRLGVKDRASDTTLWEREVPFTQRVHWSPDGQWLFLGNDYYYIEQAAIYRLPADGSAEAEMLLPDALLLDVIAAWQ